VMKMVQPLLLLIATRPLRRDSLGWEPSESCHELLKQKGLVRDRLGLMNRDDMIRFHADLVEPCSLSPDLEELLWQSAGGNLLLAQELVAHWRSKGLICASSDGEAAKVKIDPSYPFPRIVRKVIIGRLDRLSPSQQMAVKTAASLAGAFSAAELAEQMAHLEEAIDVSAVLESLVELGIFKQQTVLGDMKYSFAYELLRDGALDLLTNDQKQRLQSAIFRAS
ncbi:MAG: hypothetical protein ACK2T3_11035, partial [Candidatus Promineifilaceae bacterium]